MTPRGRGFGIRAGAPSLNGRTTPLTLPHFLHPSWYAAIFPLTFGSWPLTHLRLLQSIEDGQSYKIVNAKATESAIDLSGMNNRDVIGYTFHSGDNQRVRLPHSLCYRRHDGVLTPARQWKLKQDEGHWVFESASGSYLGVEGPPRDGAEVIGQGDKFHWDIWPDEQDPSVFKCVFIALNPGLLVSDLKQDLPSQHVLRRRPVRQRQPDARQVLKYRLSHPVSG
jgi:hypothetical protein